MDGINVAVGKPAYMNFPNGATLGASMGVDGIPGTYAQCSVATGGCWWYVDLLANHQLADIELVRLINRPASWRMNCYELIFKDAANTTTFRQQMSGSVRDNYVMYPQPPLPGCESLAQPDVMWLNIQSHTWLWML